MLIHVLLGLVLASWSLVIAVPFSESPQLAAVVATFLAVVLAILGLVVDTGNTLVLVFFSVLFPPAWYMFALKGVCGFENHQMAADMLVGDPDRGIQIAPLIVVAIVRFWLRPIAYFQCGLFFLFQIDIIIWPFFAVFLERYLYSTATILKSSSSSSAWSSNYPIQPMPPNTAISIRNLTKIYGTSWFGGGDDVTAVANLSLDIPKTGIFVMLGSNGCAYTHSTHLLFF